MSKLITEAQKREIEELGTEHWDALIAYGADLYRDGLIKGATYAIVGVGIGCTLSFGVKLLKKHNEHKDSKEES